MKQLWEKVKALKPYRANERYNEVRGNLLSSGIAYYAFFSVFPAFAIAAVIFGFVLNGHPELLNSVGDALNQALPGFVKTTSNPDGLITLEAPQLSLLTIGGIVALVSLVLSGIGWIGSFRDGIRASLGAEGSPGNLLTDKLRDLGVFVAFGLGVPPLRRADQRHRRRADWIAQRIGLGSNLSSSRWSASSWVRHRRGHPRPAAAGPVWGLAAGGGGLAGRPGRGPLLGVVKIFGPQLIGNATKNPLLGSVVPVIGLLFWLNLIARIVVLSACWAVSPRRAAEDPEAIAEADGGPGSRWQAAA